MMKKKTVKSYKSGGSKKSPGTKLKEALIKKGYKKGGTKKTSTRKRR